LRPKYESQLPHNAGDTVLAKYSETSRMWKRATVVTCTGSHVTLRFHGYDDTAAVPTCRVKAAETADAKSQTMRRKRRPAPAPPASRATRLPSASTTCEKTVAAARACLSKLAPGNFDKITRSILDLHIDGGATLAALVDLMFERAVSEPAFVEIYAQLFARCAAELPPCAASASSPAGGEGALARWAVSRGAVASSCDADGGEEEEDEHGEP